MPCSNSPTKLSLGPLWPTRFTAEQDQNGAFLHWAFKKPANKLSASQITFCLQGQSYSPPAWLWHRSLSLFAHHQSILKFAGRNSDLQRKNNNPSERANLYVLQKRSTSRTLKSASMTQSKNKQFVCSRMKWELCMLTPCLKGSFSVHETNHSLVMS